MSCLDKLKNIPGVSAIDSALKKIAPSVTQGLSLAKKTAHVGETLKGVANQIKEQVSVGVTNAINAVTGQIGATVKQVKGVAENLKKLGGGFVSAFKKTGEALAKTAKAVSEAIECEVTVIKDSITEAYEACLLQTQIQQSASNIQLSNSVAKTLSQNPEAKAAFVDAQTSATIAATAAAAIVTPSNREVYNKQVETVNKLEKIPVTPAYLRPP